MLSSVKLVAPAVPGFPLSAGFESSPPRRHRRRGDG